MVIGMQLFYTRALKIGENDHILVPLLKKSSLPHGVPALVNDDLNVDFFRIPSMDEINDAVKGLNPLSTLGNDGFTGHFYAACWEIIKYDINNFIGDFFCGGYMFKETNRTILVLLPKTESTRNIADYCPISLCNFSGKIIFKILATRLGKILPLLVSDEQAGYFQGRQITTHIVLLQELIRDINPKCKGGNVVFKLDMAKTYDRLEWRFLL
ncbi:PREDICTED: uncharacterized protein LOC105969887 [Erythranthe guttata]|uniref:uncharacterized protein LOC105969887 n=1 Tax=Erythranthe guttata TaxID=4155 RepID=UPI00064DE3E5|nr:PREDICTED: uncharacterized protein LOC105969887 [Erythranthe guttata]|eukprot:XP_012850113.1 PREDICTED: uncharacterized protein LOC105969887 [Erythranthe guttata]